MNKFDYKDAIKTLKAEYPDLPEQEFLALECKLLSKQQIIDKKIQEQKAAIDLAWKKFELIDNKLKAEA